MKGFSTLSLIPSSSNTDALGIVGWVGQLKPNSKIYFLTNRTIKTKSCENFLLFICDSKLNIFYMSDRTI